MKALAVTLFSCIISISLFGQQIDAEPITPMDYNQKTGMSFPDDNYTVVWNEDFGGSQWLNSVMTDSLGYLLNPEGVLPLGWSFTDTTGNNFNWHWSNIGPRGVYVNGLDGDAFTPNNELIQPHLENTTFGNGFLMLESDYFNMTAQGTPVANPIDINSFFEFGPLNLSENGSLGFNCNLLHRFCCNPQMGIYLYVSVDYNPLDSTGNWVEFLLGNKLPEGLNRLNNVTLNLTDLAAGHDNVYFRIATKLASHYFVIVDDIFLFQYPDYNLIVHDGWADYINDAEDPLFIVDKNRPTYNFWGGYTQIPQILAGDFVKFRAAVENQGAKDAANTVLNLKIIKDGSVDFSASSEFYDIKAFDRDTLRLSANYTPVEPGKYQVSLTVVSENTSDGVIFDGWDYSFEVTDKNNYSRVRHGRESEFINSGPYQWFNGGLEGDICVQRFNIPSVASEIWVQGIDVYLGNYRNNPNEIEAIKNGNYFMVAHLFTADASGVIVQTDIESEKYNLQISDTASWVSLNFVDNGNLTLGAGLYYAGIEIFKSDASLKFQLGNDSYGPKQSVNGGLIRFANQTTWYSTGDNYAIDLRLDKVTEAKETAESVNKISAYPNPFNNTIFINGLTNASALVVVYNMLGQALITVNSQSDVLEIPAAALQKGIYLVVVTGENERIFTQQVIKY